MPVLHSTTLPIGASSKQATMTTTMRAMILLAVMMAAIVVLSGPVAGVLDLPEPTAEAKKKKKKRLP